MAERVKEKLAVVEIRLGHKQEHPEPMSSDREMRSCLEVEKVSHQRWEERNSLQLVVAPLVVHHVVAIV